MVRSHQAKANTKANATSLSPSPKWLCNPFKCNCFRFQLVWMVLCNLLVSIQATSQLLFAFAWCERSIKLRELSEPILCYIFINGRELCPEQRCELSRACELTRVKLSGLYCTYDHHCMCNVQETIIYNTNLNGSEFYIGSGLRPTSCIFH